MICQQMHWTWDYLHTQIPFNTVKKILIDLPQYNYDDDENNNVGEPKEQSAEDFARMMNNFKL